MDGRRHDVLFDAGISHDGQVENMGRLDLSPKDIETIVLSHGHFDHTAGTDGLIRALGPRNLPVLIHPEFWSRRRLAMAGRDAIEIPTASRGALVDAGFEIIEGRRPSFLLDGAAARHRGGRSRDRLRAGLPDPPGSPGRRVAPGPPHPR